MRSAVALLALWPIIWGASRAPHPDVLEFRCSPKMGISGFRTQLFAHIEQPEKLYCPAVTIYWPEGVRSGPREADCDPLPDGEVADPWNLSDLFPAGVYYEVPPGSSTIELEVSTPSKTVRSTCTVEGHGQ